MTVDKNRVIWHSRRGMLELDLLLEPFARHRFELLSPEQQDQYQALLRCEDQDLYRWLMGSDEPDDPVLKSIIELILAAASAND